jgi:hypothetical protein
MILFLFLAHLAVGIVFSLVFVSREAGVKFFRFNAGLAVILLGVAFALRPPEASANEAGRLAVLALAVLEAAMLLYWGTVGRALASIRPAIVGIADHLYRRPRYKAGQARRAGQRWRSPASSACRAPGGIATILATALRHPVAQVSHLQSIARSTSPRWSSGGGGGRRRLSGDRQLAARHGQLMGYILSVSGIFFGSSCSSSGWSARIHVGDGQDLIDAIGDGHPTSTFSPSSARCWRILCWRRVPLQNVDIGPDCTRSGTPQFQLMNRVRAGSSARDPMCRRHFRAAVQSANDLNPRDLPGYRAQMAAAEVRRRCRTARGHARCATRWRTSGWRSVRLPGPRGWEDDTARIWRAR